MNFSEGFNDNEFEQFKIQRINVPIKYLINTVKLIDCSTWGDINIYDSIEESEVEELRSYINDYINDAKFAYIRGQSTAGEMLPVEVSTDYTSEMTMALKDIVKVLVKMNDNIAEMKSNRMEIESVSLVSEAETEEGEFSN